MHLQGGDHNEEYRRDGRESERERGRRRYTGSQLDSINIQKYSQRRIKRDTLGKQLIQICSVSQVSISQQQNPLAESTLISKPTSHGDVSSN